MVKHWWMKGALALLWGLSVTLVACVPSGGEEGSAEEAMPLSTGTTAPPAETTPTVEAITPAEVTATAETPPEGAPELPTGEVPPTLFDAALADALARSGGDRSSVTVQTAEQVQWSDGSLGCPAPDMMYTQAIVDGYHVIFDIAGQTYDYRLSDRGAFLLCQDGLPVFSGG